VSIDEPYVALPKLYGAPAYARPPAPVAVTARPFDPDQLPLELYRSDREAGEAPDPPSPADTSVVDISDDSRDDARQPDGHDRSRGLRPRSFSLRAVAGRFLDDE
jgi:hypothetical protein